MTWWTPDPDIGRDRETKALGRRDWNWFTPYPGTAGASATPADTEPARQPWAGHPTTSHDRHDRTLGIPLRHLSMWPDHPAAAQPGGLWSPDRSAAQITDDLRNLHQPPPPANLPVDHITAALAEVAAHSHARIPRVQQLVLIQAALHHRVDLATLTELAHGIGDMIAKTAHRSTRDLPGEPALNALAGANLPAATELYLARAHITRAAICSAPDLPRLWILANALTHRVPAHVILAVPARSHGPIARLHPTHDDLLGWRGIRAAVDHLAATIDAVRRGHHWLATATDTPTSRLLTLGILDLTHPTEAAALAAHGPGTLNLDRVRSLLGAHPVPTAVTDLTDPALKAVCDRNGWLHGTPDERTQRELVERHLPAPDPDHRARLARGDLTALTDLTSNAPTDADLDRSIWRRRPPTTDAVHRRQLLNIASREAIRRFTDLDITPHPTRAAALAARYPDRIGTRLLRTPGAELTVPTDPPRPSPRPPQPELDFGL
jgi:hypothetical protein